MKIFRKTFKKSFIKKKPLRKASAKAQSAMEYLMTYGWAILIVAVVLGVLYNLGVFNGTAFLGTSCIAASGFYCANPTLSTGGVLTVTIGQATGTTLNNAYLYFVPSGTGFSTSDPSASIGTLNSGQQVTVSIPLPAGSPYPAAYTLGTPISGYLYLQFTDIYGTNEVNNIATVLTKVTATGSGGATFSQPTSIPSGIVANVPITITNSQSSATPSPFQQMIQINEGNYANYIAYNGNIANFEFYTQSGQILPAWIESNNSGTLTVWVKLPNSIPASSSLTIYLGFASKTTNLLSSSGTSGIGEAPQLSSTYGEYDDGANVFNNYWNFAGTSLPSGWTGTGYTVNNGVTVNAPGGSQAYDPPTTNYIITTTASYSTSQITEFYFPQGFAFGRPSGGTVGINEGWGLKEASGTDTSNSIQVFNNYGISGTDFQTVVSGTATKSSVFTSGPSSFISTMYSTSSGAVFGIGTNPPLYNNGQSATLTSNIYTGNSYIYLWSFDSYTKVGPVYYIRTRALPPNGVMPSVSFGSLSSA